MIEVLLALAVQAAAPLPKVAEHEILVTARRLKNWRGRVNAGTKGSRCKTSSSTGDRDLDQIACDTLKYCIAQFRPQLVAAGTPAHAARDAQLQGINQLLAACGDQQHALRLVDFLDRRALAGTNNAPK